MNSAAIRRSFIEYFQARGHTHVPSSSLEPKGDPTLLFTNAGMVQFKQVFQGLERRDYQRAVTAQKCVRAGGKHNDLEQVGLTARHHTFFEMLGNFSFGDYFKKEAVEYAWEWVTSERCLGIHPDRIYVSVHHTDHDARKLWRDVTGISDGRIYGLGDKDNFWQMGDTGPCGPCSEIYVDLRGYVGKREAGRGKRAAGAAASAAPTLDEFIDLSESGQLLEIWNLVFMQFDQAADGTRTPLPAPSVDTGAGLERIAAVMQRVESDYDTDLFMPIIRRAEDIVDQRYDPGPGGIGFRVVSDHARAVAFLLADGIYPSNEGRGYVLRRILRRAVRHAYLLGRDAPVLVDLAQVVIDSMGDAYPELLEKREHITDVTREEERRFFETIEEGLSRLDELMQGAAGTIGGADAFRLYDTYGFPIDLTQLIAGERGWKIDQVGFEGALNEQRERSRIAGKGESGKRVGARHASPLQPYRPTAGRGKFTRVIPRARQKFVGYDTTHSETEILAFRHSDDQLELILRENPFYSESGGQVSDVGEVRGEGWTLPVHDVIKIDARQVVVGPYEGDFEPTGVEAVVAEERRRNIERNHTGTHLVHAALRNVLGAHVRQAGSVVAPDRLRFDFSHHAPATPEELEAIEKEVNLGIWVNADVDTRIMAYDDAIAAGAIALFGEKYGDRVRVVDVPDISMELCGGTHVRTTGQIGLFHFTHESGVAAGVRRIEAVTGPGAYDLVKVLDARVAEAAETLRTSPEHVARKIEALIGEKKRLEKQIEDLLREGGTGKGEGFEGREIAGVTLWEGELRISDRNQAGLIMDAQRAQHSRNSVFFGSTGAVVYVAVTDDLVRRGFNAGDLVKLITEGRGGGRANFASGSLADANQVPEARRRLARHLEASRT